MASAVKQVFISYATEDTDFAHRLADELKRLGARVWIAPESIPPGESWVDGIERGLRESSHVVLVLTPAALEASGAEMERDMAITLALEDRIKVISLPLKPCEVPLVLSRYNMLLAFQEDYEQGLNQLAGHLGLRVERSEAEQEKYPERIGSWPRLRLPLAVFGLLLIVLLVGVVGCGLVGGGGQPTPQPPSPTLVLGIGSTLVRDKDEMEMVYVPGGAFQMGSTDGMDHEQPTHAVALDSFWIDRSEVTNAQYARCVADGNCNPPPRSDSFTRDGYYGDSQFDDYPVIYMNWDDATSYCDWAGGRLPTEAEWEYAARGPDGHNYPWGNDLPDDTLLNYNYNVGDTTQVGSYPDGASWVGALDLAGNVWEWVNDWYADDYYATSSAENPTGPDTGDEKVLRGGSWLNDASHMRSASRVRLDPGLRTDDDGFRCVIASTSSP